MTEVHQHPEALLEWSCLPLFLPVTHKEHHCEAACRTKRHRCILGVCVYLRKEGQTSGCEGSENKTACLRIIHDDEAAQKWTHDAEKSNPPHVYLFSSSFGIENVVQRPISQGLGDINISLINIYTNYAASVWPEELVISQ